MKKPEVIVICDIFCLSKPALETQLNQLRHHVPEFLFRYAEKQEYNELMQIHQLKIVPCLLIGSRILYGIPPTTDIMEAWKKS